MLIVDDYEAFWASARALLQAGGFDVIGEAAGGMRAIEAVSMMHPEVARLRVTERTVDVPPRLAGWQDLAGLEW